MLHSRLEFHTHIYTMRVPQAFGPSWISFPLSTSVWHYIFHTQPFLSTLYILFLLCILSSHYLSLLWISSLGASLCSCSLPSLCIPLITSTSLVSIHSLYIHSFHIQKKRHYSLTKEDPFIPHMNHYRRPKPNLLIKTIPRHLTCPFTIFLINCLINYFLFFKWHPYGCIGLVVHHP